MTEEIMLKFIKSQLFDGVLDHGNHYQTNNYIMSHLCLVHFHCRNLKQMKKKVFNNVLGLGYQPFHMQNLVNALRENPHCEGQHHIHNQIAILKNEYKLPISTMEPSQILLEPLTKKIINISQKQNKKE